VERKAHGYWEFHPRHARELPIVWMAMEVGPTPGMMLVRYGLGMDCPEIPAKVSGRLLQLRSESFPATITVLSSRRAFLMFRGDPRRYELEKKREDPTFLCE
jgi:hypothetical protein